MYSAFKFKIENVRIYRDIYMYEVLGLNVNYKSKHKMQGIKDANRKRWSKIES